MPSEKARFLLGVGCHKGGTTWLHHYLTQHPAADLGFMKEYHIFDALHEAEGKQVSISLNKAIEICREMLENGLSPTNLFKRLDFYVNPAAYFDYFEHLAARREATKLVGDITPGYAGLPPDVFRSIRSNFHRRGMGVRAVFVIRDPVERTWSSARNGRARGKNLDKTEAESALFVARHPGAIVRTNYHVTMANLEAAFPPEELHYAFYESFVTRKGMQRLTAFLGIDFMEPQIDRRLNQAKKAEPLLKEVQREIALQYRDVYEGCFRKFGEETVRAHWPSARFIR